MSRLPYFPFYPGDWLDSGTIGTMELDEEGAYARLLAHQWLAGGLPDDPEKLRRMCKRPRPSAWTRIWTVLAPKFPPDADGLRRNPRLEAERAKVLARGAQQREKALARWTRGGAARGSDLTQHVENRVKFRSETGSASFSKNTRNIAEQAENTTATAMPGVCHIRSQIRSDPDPPLYPPLRGGAPETAASGAPSSRPVRVANGAPGDLFAEPEPGAARRGARLVGKHRAVAEHVLVELNAARKRVIPGAHELRPTPTNLYFIAGRLDEGHTAEELLRVIQQREAEVHARPEAAQYFNPVTPFRPANFARAVGAPGTAAASQPPPARAAASRGSAPPSDWHDREPGEM